MYSFASKEIKRVRIKKFTLENYAFFRTFPFVLFYLVRILYLSLPFELFCNSGSCKLLMAMQKYLLSTDMRANSVNWRVTVFPLQLDKKGICIHV